MAKVKNGPVITLVPPAFRKQEEYFCEADNCGRGAEFFTRVPGRMYETPEWKFLCKRHHQSQGLGFGEDIGMTLERALELLDV